MFGGGAGYRLGSAMPRPPVLYPGPLVTLYPVSGLLVGCSCRPGLGPLGIHPFLPADCLSLSLLPNRKMATNFLVHEKIWFDKFKYDDAERRFYEQMNGPVAGSSRQVGMYSAHWGMVPHGGQRLLGPGGAAPGAAGGVLGGVALEAPRVLDLLVRWHRIDTSSPPCQVPIRMVSQALSSRQLDSGRL